jgi:4-methyl-5(b-hydroxyethyl)-thiazole monophosphate biosynthesis
MSHAITILADGFEEIEAISFIDLLRRAKVEVTILGLESKLVRGSHDVKVSSDELLENFTGSADAIILPGGPGTSRLIESDRVIRTVIDYFNKGLLCAAICAAPTVLGKAGILKNKKATCFPGFESKLNCELFSDSEVVRDGNVITSRGAGTAIPFGLELIKFLCGPDVSAKIGAAILYNP